MADVVGSSQTSVNLFFEEEELELERLGVTLTPLFCFFEEIKLLGSKKYLTLL